MFTVLDILEKNKIMEIFKELGSRKVLCTASDVKDALKIWQIKPQVVNRRLSGSVQLLQKELDFDVDFILTLLKPDLFIGESHERCDEPTKICNDKNRIKKDIEFSSLDTGEIKTVISSFQQNLKKLCNKMDSARVIFEVRKLLPRNTDRYKSTAEVNISYPGMYTKSFTLDFI